MPRRESPNDDRDSPPVFDECAGPADRSTACCTDKTQVTEVFLPDERRNILPLKNGSQIDIGLGQAYLRTLDGLLKSDAGLFNALLAVAEGRKNEVDEQCIADLKNGMILRPDGTLLPGIADVLLSAYRSTPEGPVLTNPFHLEKQEQADMLDHLENQGLEWLHRQTTGTSKDDGNKGPVR